MRQQFDSPVVGNLQFDMNAIEFWETAGGELPRHPHTDFGAAASVGSTPDNWAISYQEAQESVAERGAAPSSRSGTTMAANRYWKFRNDRAIQEIRIEVREFNCIGVFPPHDHPNVYINMGDRNTILCPYCVTRYRYDPRFPPFEADPRDSLFVDPEAV